MGKIIKISKSEFQDKLKERAEMFDSKEILSTDIAIVVGELIKKEYPDLDDKLLEEDLSILVHSDVKTNYIEEFYFDQKENNYNIIMKI
jgi:hypothetical protein